MGKIANILNAKKDTFKDAYEARKVLEEGKEKLDYEDLKAAVDHANKDIIKAVSTGLKKQKPKIEIPEEIITRAIGKFDYMAAYELLAMQELLSVVVDSGAKVTHKTLEKVLASTTLFKTQMFVEIFEAMEKSKTFTREAVEFIFNHLNTHHAKDIAEKKGKVIDAYLKSGGKVDEKMKDLSKRNGIDIEQRVKDKASLAAIMERDKAKLAAKHAEAAKQKLAPAEQKEERPRSPSPGPRTW